MRMPAALKIWFRNLTSGQGASWQGVLMQRPTDDDRAPARVFCAASESRGPPTMMGCATTRMVPAGTAAQATHRGPAVHPPHGRARGPSGSGGGAALNREAPPAGGGGHHALVCQLGGCVVRRHNAVRDAFARGLRGLGLAAPSWTWSFAAAAWEVCADMSVVDSAHLMRCEARCWP